MDFIVIRDAGFEHDQGGDGTGSTDDAEPCLDFPARILHRQSLIGLNQHAMRHSVPLAKSV